MTDWEGTVLVRTVPTGRRALSVTVQDVRGIDSSARRPYTEKLSGGGPPVLLNRAFFYRRTHGRGQEGQDGREGRRRGARAPVSVLRGRAPWRGARRRRPAGLPGGVRRGTWPQRGDPRG